MECRLRSSCAFYWPAFSARAVEFDRPFLSTTGYRSFLGVQGDPVPGLSPDEFTRRVVESYYATLAVETYLVEL